MSPYPLAEDAPDPIVCFDRHWAVTFANAAARRLLSLPEEFDERTHWDLFPDARGLPVERLLRSVMDARRPGHEEFYRAARGVWFEVQAVPFDDGITVYYHDITKRKQLESQRDATAREVQAFFDAVPESILGIDRSWTITLCNKAARERATPEAVLGADLWTRFPASCDEPYASNYRRSMEDRVQREFEGYIPEPYNVWLNVIARPFGEGILVWYSDITARKQAEAHRDASVRQLEQVLEATSDAVVSLDRNWRYTFVNEQAIPLLGGRRDLIGKNVWEEFPEAVHRPSYAIHHRTMNERIATTFEDFYPAPHNRWSMIQSRPSEDGIVIFFRDTTEEHRSRQVLLDQQETLEFVQETALVATWIVDLKTRAQTISPGSYPVFGRPNESIRKVEDVLAVLHPDDVPLIARGYEDPNREAPRAQPIDYRVVDPDGTVRWLEGRRVPVFNSEGEVTHFRGMTTDVTARKLSEAKLAASEERYRVLVDLNPQTLWIGSPDGSITYVNQGFLDYRGLTAEELLGIGWIEGFFADDRARTLAAWTHSVTTGESYCVEARIRSKEGVFRWWELRALPLRGNTGAILQWLGVAHDIHDRRVAAEELRGEQMETERQRSELEAIYETAPIGLALFDPVDFRWLRLNDCQAQIFDMPKEKLLGTPLFDIVKVPGVRELFERVAGGTPVLDQMVEGELPSRPGEKGLWRVSYTPILAADGTVQAITAASLEITREKKAEAALIQSEKLAAVGRLASSISHEINNPLEAITNILYIVSGDPELPPSSADYVKLAQSELARVSQIATQTLRFHRQAVNRTWVTAADLVDAVLNLYQGRLANSGIVIEPTYTSHTPIFCFENDIRQVLNNLIANAIDAMRTGGRLIVRAHDVTDEPGGRSGVRVTIADTGHGMSAAVRARVFEPFYTTKDLNGTGLGLWISRGIVDNHQGRLTVRSSQGPRPGTVFTLFLPHSTE